MHPIIRLSVLLCWIALMSVRFISGDHADSNKARAASQDLAQVAAATPDLPRLFLDAAYVPPQGRTINVSEGEDLQAAINAAKPGDVVALQPGAIFVGNFILPNKFLDRPNNQDQWIVIRSAASDACLPSPGTRISPENADALPKIVTPNVASAIGTGDGAHHYRLIGLEIGVTAEVDYSYDLVRLGGESAFDHPIPHDLIIDRCYIHGEKNTSISRGIALNSARTAIIDSYISEIHGDGFDTQAICGWNGPGPFKIANNYLEASGENLMFGGADPSINGLIPADIEIRGNHFYKPMTWRVGAPEYAGKHWTVKNLLELKNSQRVLIEGNVFENNWADAQVGFALVFVSVNQDGRAPWSVTRDVTFINNIIRNSQNGLNLLGRDPTHVSGSMRRVLVRNNLWEDLDGIRWRSQPGIFLQISDVPDLTVDHNTVIHTGQVISVYGPTNPGFVYTNNISAHNEYGVKGDGEGSGLGTIAAYMPAAIFTKNVLAGGASNIYPANNFFPASLTEVRFANASNNSYRLAASSPYRLAGTDGKDLGCDFDALGKAVSKTLNRVPLTHSTPLPKPFCGKARL
ncbi:MAG: hypothetical protein ACKVZH_19625 [Blastocatellia bacterium]